MTELRKFSLIDPFLLQRCWVSATLSVDHGLLEVSLQKTQDGLSECYDDNDDTALGKKHAVQ